MRIAVIARYFWPDVGGAQVQMRLLAREWARLGHEVNLLTCRWNPAWPVAETTDGYQILRLPTSKTRFFGTIRFHRQVRRWLEENRDNIDVVFVSMLKHAAYASARSASRLGLPIYLKAEGGGPTGDVAWQEKAVFGLRIRRATLAVDGVFAPSEPVAAEVREAGYPRVYVVPNGVVAPELPWISSQSADYRKRLGLPDRPTLVTTGRLSPEKGLLDLVRSLPMIVRQRPDIQLVIVGDGPQRSQLESQSVEIRVADRIRFVGGVADVEPYLRAGDLYVLPSHAEGLSLGLLEALALGMPAVASDIPGNRGIMAEELLPLFPVGDADALAEAVVTQLRNRVPSELRRRQAAESVAHHYGMERVARAYIERFQR